MRERGGAELVGRIQQFTREGRRGITNQRDVIAELHRETGRRIDACVGEEPDDDDMTDAVLLQLHVEVGIGEAALPPVLPDDNITVARREIGMELASLRSLRERVAFHDAPLGGIDVLPALVVALFPLAMWDDEDTNAGRPGSGVDRAQVVEQTLFFRDLLEARPKKAALGQEV